jgi:cytidylate kinase
MATRERPIVAIDGPAGAGKSTVARKLADALGFVLFDTGALYRAVALAAKRAGVDWKDEAAATRVADDLVHHAHISLEKDAVLGVRTVLAGEDVSAAIRVPDIGMGASIVSAYPGVRAALLEMQRRAGAQGGIVLEGRDIGTVVFPDAEAKFFLTARPEIRARRRFDELVATGTKVDFEQTLAEVRRRDEQDESRAVAPLRKAEGAVLVDSSDRTVEEIVAQMASWVRAVGGRD